MRAEAEKQGVSSSAGTAVLSPLPSPGVLHRVAAFVSGALARLFKHQEASEEVLRGGILAARAECFSAACGALGYDFDVDRAAWRDLSSEVTRCAYLVSGQKLGDGTELALLRAVKTSVVSLGQNFTFGDLGKITVALIRAARDVQQRGGDSEVFMSGIAPVLLRQPGFKDVSGLEKFLSAESARAV